MSQALMEVLQMFARGEEPLKNIQMDVTISCEEPSEPSPLVSPALSLQSFATPGPSSSKKQISTPASVRYLMDCYSRTVLEERNNPKVIKIKPN